MLKGTGGDKQGLPAALGRYQLEVVRWNRQINLVSRQDTLARTADLIVQCRDAWRTLAEKTLTELPADCAVWYFDLGSGGGLPGFVWHLHLAQRWAGTKTCLVEPREKRAWFLERVGSIAPENVPLVVASRWGETGAVGWEGEPGAILVSLKALRLTDSEVLRGLSAALGGVNQGWHAGLTIARFYPPKQRLDKKLASELGLLSASAGFGTLSCSPVGGSVLAPASSGSLAASLVLSRYEISG